MASDHNNDLLPLLSAVPPPLTIALVHLAPAIAASKTVLQISSWSVSWHRSSLAVAFWCALCLLLDRRILPLILCALFAFGQWRQKLHSLQPPTTEQALQTVVTDLTTIHALLPSFPLPPIPLPTLLRVVVILYLPYILLTFFLSFRVISAVGGTILLTWRAPWAIVLRAAAWRSAWLRWSVYKTWTFLTGEHLVPPAVSAQPSINSLTPVQSLRFLFTIYENQRWWMGLDWTAALLPGERPSWCSDSQHPVSPPNGFTLPENSTVYLPDDKGGRLKRTATWKWEEPEWRVVVHKDGGKPSRVERPLPSVKDDQAPSTNSSRLLKAAGRLRESGIGGTVNASAPSEPTKNTGDPDAVSHDSHENVEAEPLTDADGWVYGDNKWEGQSNRGGMGKYTRHRKWTRVAIVFEIVESIAVGDMGIQKHETTPFLPESSSPVSETIIENQPDSPLKLRLRMALDKGSDSQQTPPQ